MNTPSKYIAQKYGIKKVNKLDNSLPMTIEEKNGTSS